MDRRKVPAAPPPAVPEPKTCPGPAVTASAPRWPEAVAWVLFGFLVLFFLVLKSFSLHFEVGDENIYFYMAWATGDHGALPYRDYFFAHPPLHLLPGIVLFWLVPFGPLTARLIPVGATLAGVTFLFLLAKRHLGRVAAVAAVLLYLNAYDLLRASSHWTGINLSCMWMILGLWAFLGKRPLLSGVFLALGVCTGSYVLPAAMMVGALALLQSRSSALRFLVGFGAPWLVVQVAGVLIGGSGYLDAVYRYHVQKPDAPGGTFGMFVRVFTDNFALFLGMVLGTTLTFLDRWFDRLWTSAPASPRAAEKNEPGGWVRTWGRLREALFASGAKGMAWMAALWSLGYVLFIGVLARVFPFYFLLMFSAMALAGGYAFERLIHHGLAIFRNRRARGRAWWKAMGALALLLAVAGLCLLIRGPVQRGLLPSYVRASDRPMKWVDAPLPEWLNGLLHRCCYADVARAYTDYGTIQEMLYHESQFFELDRPLADYVRAHSLAGETLFGDSSTAGLVALEAGRRLAGDEADTNVMRFQSGITRTADLIHRIDTPELRFVLVSGSVARGQDGQSVARYSAFASVPEFRAWLDQNFRVATQLQDRTKGTFFLLERKP